MVSRVAEEKEGKVVGDNVIFDIHRISHIPVPVMDASPDAKRLASILSGSKRILLRIASLFPFDFFPDEISIDEYKVNIIFREFFFSEDIHSVNIDMIKDVDVETNLLFATLKIVPDGYPGHPLEVKYLRKKDAIRAGSIIQGLIVARKQGVDLAKLDDDFLEKMEILGRTNVS